MNLPLFCLNFISVGFLVLFPNFPYHLISFLIMVFPTAGYVDTIRLMMSAKSSAAYSLQTVMILNGGQGAKVLYFIYHPYAIPIFGQSVSFLIVATVMSFLKYKYDREEKSEDQIRQPPKQLSISDLSRLLFVSRAQNFLEYCISITLYCILSYILFLICCVIFGSEITIDTTGLIGNLIESTVSLPTFVKIVIRRDINNISTVLVLQYIFGDMMKIVLFIAAKTPWSFLFGAFCQLAIDTILFISFLQLSFCPGTKHADEERLQDEESSAELSVPETDELPAKEEEED